MNTYKNNYDVNNLPRHGRLKKNGEVLPTGEDLGGADLHLQHLNYIFITCT